MTDIDDVSVRTLNMNESIVNYWPGLTCVIPRPILPEGTVDKGCWDVVNWLRYWEVALKTEKKTSEI